MVLPRMVYISDATELGTIYTKGGACSAVRGVPGYALYLFLDGARLPAALVAQGNDLDITDFGKYCDAFYIGGTKNGAFIRRGGRDYKRRAQAAFPQHDQAARRHVRKEALFGVQFDAYFKDGLWLDMARHAVTQAQRIAKAAQERAIRSVRSRRPIRCLWC